MIDEVDLIALFHSLYSLRDTFDSAAVTAVTLLFWFRGLDNLGVTLSRS